ncbi:pyridoxamine 5'-phosphate oxidase family protein [Falsiroseomonas oryziterrae]|uniref:pyridoxamine 5'-phosphate oxidase family protein n=1 Tax=Falsiroseomonas oryziterrae TaxID=2911368 RepID=UPI001F2C3FE6|nr:pyridoxamine 5'-phosphate oxidase family protein [Roseomonas sp. NPKOSM-4]
MTLEEVLGNAFGLLARGVADRRSAFHTPTLATVGADGAPEARTLVLRGFDPATRLIRLHSDARSGKVASLAREPRAQLHLYDAKAKLQLRLSGRTAVHASDEVADAAWRGSRDFSRMCYAVEPAPGTPIEVPPAAPRDAEGGRANFVAILLRFETLEALELAAEGHRRARFDWRGGALQASWLVP